MDVTGLSLLPPKPTVFVLPCVGGYTVTRVVKSHRVICLGAWGWSVMELGAFEMWVRLCSYEPLSRELEKKKIGVSLKKEGKVKTGSKRKDRKADSSEI